MIVRALTGLFTAEAGHTEATYSSRGTVLRRAADIAAERAVTCFMWVNALFAWSAHFLKSPDS